MSTEVIMFGIASGAVLAIMFILSCAKQKRVETMFQLDEFGNCGRTSRFPMHFNSSGVEPVGKRSLGYGMLILDRDLESITKSVVTINHCKDSLKGSCELFQTWRFGGNSFALLMMKDAVWTPLFNYDPPLRCPLKKGSYRIRNATLDLKAVAHLKIQTDGYWRTSVEAFSSDTQLFCMAFLGKCIRLTI